MGVGAIIYRGKTRKAILVAMQFDPVGWTAAGLAAKTGLGVRPILHALRRLELDGLVSHTGEPQTWKLISHRLDQLINASGKLPVGPGRSHPWDTSAK